MKKLIKYSWLLLVVLLLYVNYLHAHKEEREFQRDTKSEINKQIKTGKNKLDLRKTTSFEWDKVSIFYSFVESDRIDKVLGFKFDGLNGRPVKELHTLLIFTKKNKVVFFTEYPNIKGNFAENNFGLTLKKDEAIFDIVQTEYTKLLIAMKKGNCTDSSLCKKYKPKH